MLVWRSTYERLYDLFMRTTKENYELSIEAVGLKNEIACLKKTHYYNQRDFEGKFKKRD